MFVYLVTNKINGKKYVGQHSGNDLSDYWQRHVYLALNFCSSRALYRSIRKYGSDNFEIKPLVIVGTKWEMDLYEKGLIKAFNTRVPAGYNLTDGGDGVIGLPRDLLKARAEKISASLKGNQNCLGRIESEETRRKKSLINLENKNAVGAVRTPEYLKAMSERYKGRIFSDETKQKMSHAAHKRKTSQETKDKLSAERKARGLRPPVLSSEELANAGRISGHKRYHIARNINNPKCKLCQENK